VREVEAEVVRVDEGTLLFHMCAENLPQRLVEQVCAGVVGCDAQPPRGVDLEEET
jgi:hypothetical protein